MPLTQAVHHLAALAIFGTLVYTTIRIREVAGVGLGRVRTAALAGLALLLLELAFSRNTLFAAYGTRVQLTHHFFRVARVHRGAGRLRPGAPAVPTAARR